MMQIPRLIMTSQMAKLGHQTTHAKNNLDAELPMMEIDQEQVQVKLDIREPELRIDQSQCFSESGLKSIRELNAENAAYGVQKMYESIGRIVEQGNQLADIGRGGGDAIQQQAYYNAYDQFDREFNLGTMPKSRPKIDVIEGDVELTVEGGTVQLTPKLGEVKVDYEPGKVSVYLEQRNSLTIQVVGGKFDQSG